MGLLFPKFILMPQVKRYTVITKKLENRKNTLEQKLNILIWLQSKKYNLLNKLLFLHRTIVMSHVHCTLFKVIN